MFKLQMRSLLRAYNFLLRDHSSSVKIGKHVLVEFIKTRSTTLSSVVANLAEVLLTL